MVGIDKAIIIFVVCASSISFPFDSFYFHITSDEIFVCFFQAWQDISQHLACFESTSFVAHQRLRWVLEETGSRKVELVEFVGRPDGWSQFFRSRGDALKKKNVSNRNHKGMLQKLFLFFLVPVLCVYHFSKLIVILFSGNYMDVEQV